MASRSTWAEYISALPTIPEPEPSALIHNHGQWDTPCGQTVRDRTANRITHITRRIDNILSGTQPADTALRLIQHQLRIIQQELRDTTLS